eukprot:10325758-Alexandrium_andersonii.AAC.1
MGAPEDGAVLDVLRPSGHGTFRGRIAHGAHSPVHAGWCWSLLPPLRCTKRTYPKILQGRGANRTPW